MMKDFKLLFGDDGARPRIHVAQHVLAATGLVTDGRVVFRPAPREAVKWRQAIGEPTGKVETHWADTVRKALAEKRRYAVRYLGERTCDDTTVSVFASSDPADRRVTCANAKLVGIVSRRCKGATIAHSIHTQAVYYLDSSGDALGLVMEIANFATHNFTPSDWTWLEDARRG